MKISLQIHNCSFKVWHFISGVQYTSSFILIFRVCLSILYAFVGSRDTVDLGWTRTRWTCWTSVNNPFHWNSCTTFIEYLSLVLLFSSLRLSHFFQNAAKERNEQKGWWRWASFFPFFLSFSFRFIHPPIPNGGKLPQHKSWPEIKLPDILDAWFIIFSPGITSRPMFGRPVDRRIQRPFRAPHPFCWRARHQKSWQVKYWPRAEWPN